MGWRTTHGDALLQAGQWADAADRFGEAEAMQRDRQPDLPLLYSVQGYRWCDLKLAQGRAGEVAARADYMIRGEGSFSLLTKALYRLVAGRAAHLAAAEGVLDDGSGSNPGQRLDDAVEGLRAAGQTWFLPPGLLARAAWHRDNGALELARQDLIEAFDIAERGGMRPFLADCEIESAWLRLAASSPSAEDLTAAAAAIERAAAIVAATGYHRRDPDLSLARAGVCLARGEHAQSRLHIDDLVAAMRAHNLWGFLPHLECLAGQHGLYRDDAPPGLALGRLLAALRTERAAFDKDADAAFEDARKVRRADGLDDDVIDARLADPEFRSRLNAALVGSGYKPLDDTPIEEQRNDARNYILNVERKQSGAEGEADAPPPLPDAMVDAMLADAGIRDALTKLYKDNDLDTPFEQIPREMHARILAKLVADGVINVEEKPADTPQPPPAAAPPPPPAQGQPQQSGGVLSRLFGRWMRRNRQD